MRDEKPLGRTTTTVTHIVDRIFSLPDFIFAYVHEGNLADFSVSSVGKTEKNACTHRTHNVCSFLVTSNELNYVILDCRTDIPCTFLV